MGNSEAVTVFATFRPKAGHEGETLTVLNEMIGNTRAEHGNLTYDLYTSEEGGRALFHLFERYRDDAALRAHRDAGYFRDYRARIREHLDAPIAVAALSDVDVQE